jgi:hypothetical protein
LKEIKGSLTEIVMLGDGAANPFTIPAQAASLEHTFERPSLRGRTVASHPRLGWREKRPNAPRWPNLCQASGICSKVKTFNDSTVDALVIYAGSKTGWLNSLRGAPS